MKFLIPSYKRAGIASTIDYLVSVRVPYGDILVGVQTEDDYEAYTIAYRHVPLLLNDAHNAAGNRNALIGTLQPGEKAVLLDDDLSWLAKARVMDDGSVETSRISTPHEFRRFIDDGFEIAQDGIWGIKIGANFLKSALMKNGGLNKSALIGNLIGFTYDVNKPLSFDPGLNNTDDHDAIFNSIFIHGSKTVRINYYIGGFDVAIRRSVLDGKADGMLPGGCEDSYLESGSESWSKNSKIVASRYPGLVNAYDPEIGRMSLTKKGRKRALANWDE